MQSPSLNNTQSEAAVCLPGLKTETKLRHCVACGKPVLFKRTGRPPKYCADCQVTSTARVTLHREMKRVEQDAKKNTLEALVDRVMDEVKLLTVDSINVSLTEGRTNRRSQDHPAFASKSAWWRRVPITARTIRGKLVVTGYTWECTEKEDYRIPKYGQGLRTPSTEGSLATTPRKVTHQVDENDRPEVKEPTPIEVPQSRGKGMGGLKPNRNTVRTPLVRAELNKPKTNWCADCAEYVPQSHKHQVT